MEKKEPSINQLHTIGIKPNKNTIKYKGQNIWVQKVAPPQAKFVLKNLNPLNRDRDLKRVNFIEEEIVSGRYAPLLRTIKFSKDGKLIDGQNFLAAIVKSDIAVETLISDSHNEEDMELIDNGKNRTASDSIKIYGKQIKNVFIEKNSSKLAKMTRHLNTINTFGYSGLGHRDKLSNRLIPNTKLLGMVKNKAQFKSFKETIDVVREIVEMLFDGRINEMKKIMGDQVAYVMFEIIKNKYGIKTSKKFFKELFEGRGKLLMPRNYLIKLKKDKKYNNTNYAIQYYIMCVIFNAWNKKKSLTPDMYEISKADDGNRQYNIIF